MKEYLRRAAWWTKATKRSDWYPFFDIAAAVDPAVRAAQVVVGRVSANLSTIQLHPLVRQACINALHFAALLDARVPLPAAPDLPYEPLLKMFERGEGFWHEGSGFLDVDTIGVPIGKIEDNLRERPYVELDDAALDALDLLPRHHR
jgi:hypothetical protein